MIIKCIPFNLPYNMHFLFKKMEENGLFVDWKENFTWKNKGPSAILSTSKLQYMLFDTQHVSISQKLALIKVLPNILVSAWIDLVLDELNCLPGTAIKFPSSSTCLLIPNTAL